ncbi:hypothetical protein [Kocuria rhizophila]|uniref:hypothetical protein n=1 Tax=Kocuria rhizophila TaxID=72000 RepID=UPI00057EE326|nr:hypothetical protein [Kocuria rhizophila]KIC68482.1 hypothetical protein RK09_06595 [Kocuria rhizophila]
MTQQHDAARALTRRTLAKGAAWSVPVIAAASVAPALAASSACTPVLRFSGGLFYDFGVIDSGTGKTSQYLTVGGQTYVDNLPPGVTVTDIRYTFWMENRQGQQSSGPGVFWMGNATASTAGYCNSSGCSAPWSPTSGSGFSRTVTNTRNNVATTYPDGTTVPSWDLNMSWTASQDTANRYTTTSDGCRNFDSGPSSRFRVNYTGVTSLTSADVRNGKKSIRSFADITVKLSNGAVLEKTYPVVYTG